MPVAILSACLFAMTGVCATQAIRCLGPVRANFWRLAVALSLFALWLLLFGGAGDGWRHAGGWFLLAGLVGFGMGGGLMFMALSRIGSTLGLLVVECAATLFALLIGWVFLGALPSLQQWLLVALILAGVAVGSNPGLLPGICPRSRRAGVALAAAAALMQAISFNLSKHGFNRLAESGLELSYPAAAALRLVGGGALALLILVFVSRAVGVRADAPAAVAVALPAPVWVLLNALCGPVLGVTAMLWAIRLVANPGLVQAVVATATLLTLPLARKLENARARRSYWIGSCLALAGVAGLLLV